MEEEEQKKVYKALRQAFGYPYQVVRDLKGVPVELRTLYDFEEADALRRSQEHKTIEEQAFHLKRWRLAYSLVMVNETELAPTIQEKYELILSWLSYIVEQLYELLIEIAIEEEELEEIIKKSTGTVTQTENTEDINPASETTGQ